MSSENDPSGHALAQAAHAAGVVEPAVELPNVDVQLSFIVRGDEEHARSVAEAVTLELIARSDVEQATWSVTSRDEAGVPS